MDQCVFGRDGGSHNKTAHVKGVRYAVFRLVMCHQLSPHCHCFHRLLMLLFRLYRCALGCERLLWVGLPLIYGFTLGGICHR